MVGVRISLDCGTLGLCAGDGYFFFFFLVVVVVVVVSASFWGVAFGLFGWGIDLGFSLSYSHYGPTQHLVLL